MVHTSTQLVGLAFYHNNCLWQPEQRLCSSPWRKTSLIIELLHNCVLQFLLTWNESNPKMCFPPQNDDRGCVMEQLAPLRSLFLIMALVGGGPTLPGSLKGGLLLPGEIRGLFFRLKWETAQQTSREKNYHPVSAWPLPANEPTARVYQHPQPHEDLLVFHVLQRPRGETDMAEILVTDKSGCVSTACCCIF